MIKFPSINQFRNTIKQVQDRSRWVGRDDAGVPIFDNTKPIPTLKFTGTVKLHGTNAAIVLNKQADDYIFQSRERILELTSDNAGFMLHMKNQEDALDSLFAMIMNQENADLDDMTDIVVFGEWCGGNIQKGVAISGLPKMFVVFAAKVVLSTGYSRWIEIKDLDLELENLNDAGIYNIYDFGTWEMEIDFNHPQLSQQKLVDLTLEVENECPVGKHFGQSGVGEGIVWHCKEPGWYSSDFWFKTKGEKHSVSKVKTLAPVDVEAYEKQKDFIDSVVTEARLEQGLHNLINEQQKPFEMTSLGDFIRWVFNDVIKEEMDTIIANQFDPKKLGGPISNKARPWFIQRLNEGN